MNGMNSQDYSTAKIMDLLNNPNDAKRQINDFASTIQGDPKQQVEQLLASGRMSQGQYNMLSKFANMFMKFL